LQLGYSVRKFESDTTVNKDINSTSA